MKTFFLPLQAKGIFSQSKTCFLCLFLLCIGLFSAQPPAWGEAPWKEKYEQEAAKRFGVENWSALQWQEIAAKNDITGKTGFERLDATAVGSGRFIFRFTFSRLPNFLLARLNVWIDWDNRRASGVKDGRLVGMDALVQLINQNYSFTFLGTEEDAKDGSGQAIQIGSQVYVMFNAPLTGEGEPRALPCRISARYTEKNNSDDVILTSPTVVLVPSSGKALDLAETSGRLVFPAAAYRRMQDTRNADDGRTFSRPLGIAYEAKEHRGLHREIVTPEEPFEFGRSRPHLPLGLKETDKPLTFTENTQTLVTLQNPIKDARTNSVIRFGFPFAQGKIFSTKNIRLLDENDNPVAANVSIVSKWPDDSIKWVMVDTFADFPASTALPYKVEYGPEVESLSFTQPVKLTTSPDSLEISNAFFHIHINPKSFSPLGEVKVEDVSVLKSPRGMVLTDTNGTQFSTGDSEPETIRVAESSANHIHIRAEGRYRSADGKSFMRYITRLIVRAGSPVVEIEHTHINDELDWEFTDFKSLVFPLELAQAAESFSAAGSAKDALQPVTGARLNLTQWTDQNSEIQGTENPHENKPLAGAFLAKSETQQIGIAFQDFWQRYPKQIQGAEKSLSIALLPAFENSELGNKLPIHLAFPFLDDAYRLKWGMSFTERFYIDFGKEQTIESLRADAVSPIIPHVDYAYLASTKALGNLPDLDTPLMKRWDPYVKRMTSEYLKRQVAQRDYGFLNYGDWFGERGRSWGNNEYDSAHAFFMEFLRTGAPEPFALALSAARHQADVDIIHAYPDKRRVGAQYIHGIAHTGTTSHIPPHGTWSQDYGLGAWAGNGHTWAEGLTEAFLLKGDSRPMESAIALGEHIRWAMAPVFEMSETAPRYAGWSLRAITALQSVLYDDEYATASEMIAHQATTKQTDTGAWVYEIRGGGGVKGNTIFQHGVLLAGLKQYHALTQDDSVMPTMIKTSQFLVNCWEIAGGWPYMVQPDAQPHPFKPDVSSVLNIMSADGLAYTGRIQQNQKMLEVARKAFLAQIQEFPDNFAGQKIGYSLRSGLQLMADIQHMEPSDKPVEASSD